MHSLPNNSGVVVFSRLFLGHTQKEARHAINMFLPQTLETGPPPWHKKPIHISVRKHFLGVCPRSLPHPRGSTLT